MDEEIINHRYRLEGVLGKGGMGEVYNAYDRLTRQPVALKRVTAPAEQLVFASMSANTDFRVALAQEFHTLASLRHPHIISVLDYGFGRFRDKNGETHIYPYYTMEQLSDPQPVVSFGTHQPLGVQVDLITQILYALSYLHRRGIIHRDLKPENVMVTDGQVKLLDFGLAVTREYLAEREEIGAVGTLAYLAPEVLIGAKASEMSDLYAVGLMTYEMLAGQHPFNLNAVTALTHDIIYSVPDIEALETAPKLKGVIQRLLQKQPPDRYASADEVLLDILETAEFPTQKEVISLRESSLQAACFVGREKEMGQLTTALNEAFSGTGSAWLIGGESGVGKSRLLDELRALGLVKGALVLRGQAIFEGGAPYRVWHDALRRLCLQTRLSDLEASVIKAFVPDIETLLERKVDDAPPLDPQAASQRLLNVVEDVFRRQTQPMLILLEDLQWASESLVILARMIHVARELPILIVANYRDDERPELPEKLPDARLLKLERLKPKAIAALSESMLGSAGRDEAIVELLQRETEGNVFFIVEVVRALADYVVRPDELLHKTLPNSIFAQGIKDIIQRRLSRVPEYAHPMLQAAAVAGRELDLSVLRLVGTNYLSTPATTMALETWLSACADASVLEVQDNGWRFAHDKLREGILVDLPKERKSQLHRQIARAIEQAHMNDSTYTAALAYHWSEAHDPAQEAYYTALAGEQALTNGAHQEAISFLTRAIGLATQTHMKQHREAQLEQQLGDAHYGLGHLPETEEHLKRSLALMGYPYPDSPLRLQLRIWSEYTRQAWHRLRLDITHRPFLPGEQTIRFIMAARASEGLGRILFLQNNKRDMIYYGVQALNCAEQAGADGYAEQLRSYAGISLAVGTIPRHWLARAYVNRTNTVMNRASEDAARNWADQVIAIYASGRGDWEEAEIRLKHAIALAEKLGNWRRWHECSGLLATVYTLIGRWKDSLAISADLYAKALQHGDIQGQAAPQIGQARLALRQGHFQRGLELIGRAVPIFEMINDRVQITSGFGLTAALYLRLDKKKKGEENASHALEMMAQHSPTAFYSIEGYTGTLEWYLAAWEQERSENRRLQAQQALYHLKNFAKIFDVARPRWLAYQSWYHWLDGKPDQARQNGEKAVQEAGRLHMPYDESLAHYHLGRFLTGDQRGEHLNCALEGFEKLGAAWDVECVQNIMRN